MTINWWTLGIQTVNVAVLVWLLGRFFWRPVAAIIEQRRATTQRTLADAAAMHTQAAAELAEIERTRAGFAQERETILAAARDAAEQARIVRLQEAATDVAALEAAAREAADKGQLAADTAWAERASQLAVEIAGRLLARLDGAAIRATFLEWLLVEIRRLPGPARQDAAADGVTLEAVSPAALDPADQARYRTLIGTAFDAHPQIAFRADPALIAGLELHGPNFTVSNSWGADLSKILADIAHDSRR